MTTSLAKVADRIERLDRRGLFIALNLFALAVFFFIAFRYNYLDPNNMGRLMFSTPDTKKYREIADWLSGTLASAPASTKLVPLLYPLFLASVRQVTANAYVFWAVQFLLWLASLNLVAIAVYRFTRRRVLLAIAFGVMALNISAMVMTFYALAETVSLFLWSVWLLLLSRSNWRHPAPRDVFWSTLLLSLMTVVKSIFQIHLVLYLVFVLLTGIRPYKKYLGAALALVPVLLQIVVNVNLNGIVGVSNISEYTVKSFLLPQVYSARAAVSFEQAKNLVQDYDSVQIAAYLARDPVSSAAAFLRNVGENLTSASEYISYYDKPYAFTRITNVAYLIVQVLLLPAVLYVFVRKRQDLALVIQLLYLFSLIIIITSGISFDEGDRLVLTALPLWVVIYSSLPVLFLGETPAERAMAPVPAS